MPNTREKLIELCRTACTPDNCRKGTGYDKRCYECLADHLIAHGVTFQNRDIHWATEQAYKNGYEAGYPKWIPVTERLPEDWVLCACVDGEVHILCYDYIMDDWDIWGRPNTCYGKPFVTHWMPLPEAPKGE